MYEVEVDQDHHNHGSRLELLAMELIKELADGIVKRRRQKTSIRARSG